MSTHLLLRPVAAALAALAIAACGTAFAASATIDIDPPIPPLPAVADVSAIVAQAKQIARAQLDDRMLLAFDEDMMGMPMSMGWLANEFGHPREIVKNAPYSAEAVTEYVQSLPDGNRIVKKSSTLLARDGQGRTRQERKGDGRGGVYIYDPMENRSIVLNESSRTVTRIPRMPDFEGPVPPMPPVTPAPPMAPAPPAGATGAPGPGTPGAAVRREVETRDGRVIVRRRSGDETASAEDVRVEVIRMPRGDNAGMPMPPMPPLTLPIMPRGKGETKSLGTREFDGIKAEGTMTSHTIPAGAIGNEKPIVVTSERWFSPDLFIVVFAKTSDPRAGETTYRVTNIKRTEPSADLFKVPADYKPRGEGRESRSKS